MTVAKLAVVAWCSLLVACAAGARRPESAPAPWLIAPARVGPLALDQPIPPALLAADAADRYEVRYLGDGVPLEGLRLRQPPVFVGVSGGPFASRVAAEGLVEPDAAPYREAGARALRQGAAVSSLIIDGPGPRTAAGIEVQSTLAALRQAYGDLKLGPVPPALGEDECVATTPALPTVTFVLRACPAGQATADERVRRIDLRR